MPKSAIRILPAASLAAVLAAASLTSCGGGGGGGGPSTAELQADGQNIFQARVWARNHVDRQQLAHAACSGGAGIRGSAHGRDIPTHQRGHVT